MEQIVGILEFAGLIAPAVGLIAGFSALWVWLRKPLAISRVVIHRHPEQSNYNVILKNRKNYAVTIKALNCYTSRKEYDVVWYEGERPELSVGYSGEDSVIHNRDEHEIAPAGDTRIKLTGRRLEENPKHLVFTMETSHGTFEVTRNNKIMSLDMNAGQMREVRFQRSYDSRIRAWGLLILVKLFGRFLRK